MNDMVKLLKKRRDITTVMSLEQRVFHVEPITTRYYSRLGRRLGGDGSRTSVIRDSGSVRGSPSDKTHKVIILLPGGQQMSNLDNVRSICSGRQLPAAQ
jgi:hypothetical protein